MLKHQFLVEVGIDKFKANFFQSPPMGLNSDSLFVQVCLQSTGVPPNMSPFFFLIPFPSTLLIVFGRAAALRFRYHPSGGQIQDIKTSFSLGSMESMEEAECVNGVCRTGFDKESVCQ